MKQAYIVGGAGFLGRHLHARLAANGWRVAVIDPAGETVDGVHHERGPIADPLLDKLAAAGWTPTHVFHLGGSGSVGQAEADPALDFNRTVTATATLMRRFVGTSTRIVFVSSAAVYGECGEQPLEEAQTLRPISTYGRHKAQAEALFSGDVSHAIVRFFSLYGEGLRKQLLWDACHRLRAGDPMFSGTGEERRDWLHVSDAVTLLERVALADDRALVVNGASGKSVSVAQALAILARALKVTNMPRFSGVERAGDPRHLVASMQRAATLGFSPTISLDVGLAAYARWFEAEGC